jgi:hypothetical protein
VADGLRTEIPFEVRAGDVFDLELIVDGAALQPGRHTLAVTLVHEFRHFFDDVDPGSVLRMDLDVIA